jgi:predicted Zn-dependent protease
MNRQVQTLQARFLNYSRDQESEADACAVRMMAGIDAATARTAVAAFLKDLGEDGDGTAVARGRLSSHPSYRERKGKIDRVLAYYDRGAEKRAPTPRP